jgi:hypothetical protein
MEHRGASSADNISGDGAGIDCHMIEIILHLPVFIHHLFICTFRYIQEYMCTGIRDTNLSHKDSRQCLSKELLANFENFYLNLKIYN